MAPKGAREGDVPFSSMVRHLIVHFPQKGRVGAGRERGGEIW